MIATQNKIITVEATVNAPVEKVWNLWTAPEHITQWNSASPDWHSPKAQNDLREGGKFTCRMEARDGSMGFDFGGEYTKVTLLKELAYVMDDGRKVNVWFTANDSTTHIKESFDAETTHSEEMQQSGWQAILDNFKKYAEAHGKLETLHFEVSIDAPVEKVYTIMLDDQGFRQWTAEFNASSYYKGSWEKGSKIYFIGTNNEGMQEGMVSRIKENIPNQFVSIEHQGFLDGDNEILSGPTVDGWAGALENYSFREEGGKTILLVDMDAHEQFKTYFEKTWPSALQKLKEICEQ